MLAGEINEKHLYMPDGKGINEKHLYMPYETGGGGGGAQEKSNKPDDGGGRCPEGLLLKKFHRKIKKFHDHNYWENR